MSAQNSEARGGEVVQRDKQGRLLPGAKLNPGGRMRKKPDKDLVKAINNAATPERVEELITDAFDWCRHYKSVKGAVSLLQLVLGYQLGQPVKRTVSASLKVDDILGSVADIDDEQLEQTIDALYSSEE